MRISRQAPARMIKQLITEMMGGNAIRVDCEAEHVRLSATWRYLFVECVTRIHVLHLHTVEVDS